MENSPLDRGLTLTLTWGGGAYRVRRSFPLGAAFRIVGALALCAACFEAGRWHGALEAQAARPSLRALAAAPAPRTAPAAEAPTTAAAPGKAVGAEEQDVITPLNVRDPSALVMAPFATQQIAAQAPPEAPPALPSPQDLKDEELEAPPARIFPRPSSKVKPDARF